MDPLSCLFVTVLMFLCHIYLGMDFLGIEKNVPVPLADCESPYKWLRSCPPAFVKADSCSNISGIVRG